MWREFIKSNKYNRVWGRRKILLAFKRPSAWILQKKDIEKLIVPLHCVRFLDKIFFIYIFLIFLNGELKYAI